LKRDSLDKIVGSYFAAVTAESFVYGGVEYEPRPLLVSPLILRGFTCPSGCGGCCSRFSLDYLPTEKQPAGLSKRWVDFSGHRVRIHSDMQDNTSRRCQHLDSENGRCGIYEHRPFSCDFELIRFLFRMHRLIASQQLYGRGWAMQRVDGGTGAACEMLSPTDASIAETVRKLYRLEAWARHFRLKTRVSEIIEWCKRGPHKDPLRMGYSNSDNGLQWEPLFQVHQL